MKRHSSDGYSVVELVIVVSLVAILGMISFPAFASYSVPFRVQSAGREVYSALQDVRQQAITRGARTRFLPVGSDSYTLQWDSTGTWRTIRGPIQLEGNVRLSSSGGDLTFQPRGTVSPLSTITVSDMNLPQHDLVMTVPITGLIRVRDAGE